jgi:hypothetical protein
MKEKIIKNFERDEEAFHEECSETLKNHAGYILMTCRQPTESGRMQVEMSYGGSLALVNMLIDGAQELLGEQKDEEEDEEDL